MADDLNITHTPVLESANDPAWVELDVIQVPPTVREVLPPALMRRWRVLPLSIELDDTCLVVATAPPVSAALVRAVTEISEYYVEVVYAQPAEIDAALWRTFCIEPRDGWA
ncbi:MAG: hypothetical protein GY913_05350 [Proteobacteria bacterium]|nr:hypothetical protein [Pseudomonadota bacterium]MCP4916328.1 hypothetical protein [Pseudomonadota bacterium]